MVKQSTNDKQKEKELTEQNRKELISMFDGV